MLRGRVRREESGSRRWQEGDVKHEGEGRALGGGVGGAWGRSRSGKAAGLAPRGCCNVLAQLAVLQAGSLMRAPLRYDQVAAGPVPSVNSGGEFFPAFSSS